MKHLLLPFSFFLGIGMALAQNNPIDFEPGGFGADWTWSTFEAPQGASDPDFNVVANPFADEANPSDNVAEIAIEYPSSEPWGQAGCESQHGADLGAFSFTSENSTVTLQFYQVGFASNVALKFATPEGAAFFEQIFTNDLSDQWVTATFDMSEWIGDPLGQPDQIIFFPSYGPRETGHTVYFDNVVFGEAGPSPDDPQEPAPDPTVDEDLVLSVYSDTYQNNVVSDFNFNAFQGGGTVSEIQIQGNNTGKIEGLTFYGAEWTAADVSEFDFVHLDYYATTSTAFNFYIIDQNAGIPGGAPEEPRFAFGPGGDAPLVQGEWVSVDMPLEHFLDFPTGPFNFNLENIFQWKFDGNGTLYFDNVYFFKDETVDVSNIQASDFHIFPNPAKESWNIDAGGLNMLRIQVFNAVGQQVWAASPQSSLVQIEAGNLPAGLYLARIESAEGAAVIKLIKH